LESLVFTGADITVFPAAISKPLPSQIKVRPTLARGRFRIPNRLLGRMAYARLHDWIVSRRIEKMAGQIDIIHTWPLGALQTLRTAARLGIPTVLARCNAHTRFAYEVVQRECDLLGVALPPDHEHAFNAELLRREEEEYQLAHRLLCPSDFVVRSFVEKGFPREKLVRFIHGYDEHVFHADDKPREPGRGLTMVSVGMCAVRKGLHYALKAWIESPASREGRFLIAGEFLPAYRHKLSPLLAHPSVSVLGFHNDIPGLMRGSDVLVLASIEEGFGLVCTEAMASGCVPLVSDACTDICQHLQNAMVHHVGDVASLARHITMLHEDRALLARLRAEGLRTAPQVTWAAAAARLHKVYGNILAERNSNAPDDRRYETCPACVG
jgi:glycosyltransferase involved in cell wall biosynthesis